MDILTKLKTYDVSKLQEAMIQFRYARTRLKKYGHAEPEPSQLFETLKAAASALTGKGSEFAFRFQHYIMKHNSVNGLVKEQTVQELYAMIVDNARGFVDGAPNPAGLFDATKTSMGPHSPKVPVVVGPMHERAQTHTSNMRTRLFFALRGRLKLGFVRSTFESIQSVLYIQMFTVHSNVKLISIIS